MNDRSIVCEACRRDAAEMTISLNDGGETCRICRPCSERLARRALRPLEWFNLVALHGWGWCLLHEDFYSQDGIPHRPDVEDYAIDGRYAPTLGEASRDLDRLLDFCITRFWLREPEWMAFESFDDVVVLDRIEHRAGNGNRQIRRVCLRLCAKVLGPSAGPWVREQFRRSCDDNDLFTWAQAAARCLPTEEGLEMTQGALGRLHGFALVREMSALVWFRSAAVLDWIETVLPPAHITPAWGQLAARSDFCWRRAKNWIAAGRPLSIVALNALQDCILGESYLYSFGENHPTLGGCPDPQVIRAVVERYMEVDDAPRMLDLCNFIINHVDTLQVSEAPDPALS